MQTAIGLTLTDRCDSKRTTDGAVDDEYGHPVTAERDVLGSQACRFLPKAARAGFDEYRQVVVHQDAIMVPLSTDIRAADAVTQVVTIDGFTVANNRTVDAVTRRRFYKVAYLRGRDAVLDDPQLTPIRTGSFNDDWSSDFDTLSSL